ncbi:hypothetical protein ACVFI8_11925 [Agarivorans sp. MS3-6]
MDLVKLVSLPVIALSFLIGCGGGSSNSSQTTNNEESVPELPSVQGEFKSKKDSGFVFPTNLISMYASNKCQRYDRYYETENVLVFGSAVPTAELFERFATWTEFGLTELKQKMGVDLVALQQKYPFSLETYLTAAKYLQEQLGHFEGNMLYQQITGEELPLSYEDITSFPEQQKFLYKKVRQLSLVQLNTLIKIIQEDSAYSKLSASFAQALPGKPIVCLNPAYNSSDLWATGNLVGYTARTNDARPSSAYIVTHELTHTLQHQYVTYLSQVDRWFLEGSAEYAMGHKPDPNNHTKGYPLDDKYQSVLGSNSYSHYGIAVTYLEGTSPGFTMNVLKHIADHGIYHVVEYGDYSEYEYDKFNQPNPDFRAAFNAYAKRPDGSALTYADFESEYHELIDQWIAISPTALSRSSSQLIDTNSEPFLLER